VLRLHKFDGLSHGEVAARLGISKSAVEKHMAVAMAHLRRLLAAEVSDSPRRLEDGGGPDTVETGAK
jgi:DNA-directed RNA polymerase specialized sigma24 family protein